MSNIKMSQKLREEVLSYMAAADEQASNFPDGAWFAYLEENAEKLIQRTRLKHLNIDGNDLVHWYLENSN